MFAIVVVTLVGISNRLTELRRVLERSDKRLGAVCERQEGMKDILEHNIDVMCMHLYDLKLILDPDWQKRQDKQTNEMFKFFKR